MKLKNRYVIQLKKLNENNNGTSEYENIKIQTGNDLVNTICFLMELLKINTELDNNDFDNFEEIYKKSNKN